MRNNAYAYGRLLLGSHRARRRRNSRRTSSIRPVRARSYRAQVIAQRSKAARSRRPSPVRLTGPPAGGAKAADSARAQRSRLSWMRASSSTRASASSPSGRMASTSGPRMASELPPVPVGEYLGEDAVGAGVQAGAGLPGHRLRPALSGVPAVREDLLLGRRQAVFRAHAFTRIQRPWPGHWLYIKSLHAPASENKEAGAVRPCVETIPAAPNRPVDRPSAAKSARE